MDRHQMLKCQMDKKYPHIALTHRHRREWRQRVASPSAVLWGLIDFQRR